MKTPSKHSECICKIVWATGEGKIVTYGDISKKVYGSPKGEQGVASAIKAKSRTMPNKFPWWRVVNKELKPTSATPAGAEKDARQLLKKGRVCFRHDGSVNRKHRRSF